MWVGLAVAGLGLGRREAIAVVLGLDLLGRLRRVAAADGRRPLQAGGLLILKAFLELGIRLNNIQKEFGISVGLKYTRYFL